MCVVRGQLKAVGSLLASCGSRESNLGHRVGRRRLYSLSRLIGPAQLHVNGTCSWTVYWGKPLLVVILHVTERYEHVCMYVYACVCTCACLHAFVYVYVSVCMHVHVCVSACVFTHAHILVLL